MPATELIVTSLGQVGGKELLVPTGKLKAKTPVKDVSTAVLVKGIKQWAVYEEKSGSKTIRTVFKIT